MLNAHGVSVSENYYKKHMGTILMCVSGKYVGSNNCWFTDNVRINQTSDEALNMLPTAKYTVNSTITNKQMLWCFYPDTCNIFNLYDGKVYVLGEHIIIVDIYIPYLDK